MPLEQEHFLCTVRAEPFAWLRESFRENALEKPADTT
jgi:hypothetical protein